MPTKRTPAEPTPTYAEWKAHAAALIERQGISAGFMREKEWRKLFIQGSPPEDVVRHGLLVVLLVTQQLFGLLGERSPGLSGAKVICTRRLVRGAARVINRFRGLRQVMFKSGSQVAHENINTADPVLVRATMSGSEVR
jgi:hypothetical protein